MAWRRPGDKPLSEPMIVNLLMRQYRQHTHGSCFVMFCCSWALLIFPHIIPGSSIATRTNIQWAPLVEQPWGISVNNYHEYINCNITKQNKARHNHAHISWDILFTVLCGILSLPAYICLPKHQNDGIISSVSLALNRSVCLVCSVATYLQSGHRLLHQKSSLISILEPCQPPAFWDFNELRPLWASQWMHDVHAGRTYIKWSGLRMHTSQAMASNSSSSSIHGWGAASPTEKEPIIALTIKFNNVHLIDLITTKFCTCHCSNAAVACVKFCSDWIHHI